MKLKENHVKQRMWLLLMFAIFLYSFVSVFAKIAGQYDFLTIQFGLFYGISLTILGVYAVFWQIALEKIPLVSAYMVRSLISVYIYIWSIVFFGEKMTVTEIVGAMFIILGVIISQK